MISMVIGDRFTIAGIRTKKRGPLKIWTVLATTKPPIARITTKKRRPA